VENLGDDYIFVVRCEREINYTNSRFKLLKIYEIFRDNNVVNYGNPKTGSILTLSESELDEGIKDGAPINGVFRSIQDVRNVIKGFIDNDFGLSVVISGLYDDIQGCCGKLKIKPHTVNNSLGIWGRTELLPEKEYLEMTTMCGHGLIGVGLIKDVMEQIKKSRISLEEGALNLGKGCICGAFNTERAQKLLHKLVEEK
jgi:hypothetical protein